MIKKNQIITIIKKIEKNVFKALIIIPIRKILFTKQSINLIENILIKLFDNPKSILYTKEKDILKQLEISDYSEIRRSFALTFNNMSETIIEDEQIIENDQTEAKIYIDLFKHKQCLFNENDKIENIIFEYN